MRYLLTFFTLVLAPAMLLAQQVVIHDPIVTTPTQAIIHVSATNADGSPFAGACFYSISEGSSFTAKVYDVDTNLFSGADSDARQGSIIDGPDHFFVAGTRKAEMASDSNFYSRALQTATQHWVGVTCGTTTVSTTFTTQTPPLGNTYPEFPAFDTNAWGNVANPTIDFSDKTKQYIDPLTGVLLKRISSPLDRSTSYQQKTFTWAQNVNGTGWSNPLNAVTNQVSGTLATTSTPNSALFMAWPGMPETTSSYDFSLSVDDVRLRAYCSGQNGGKLQACISLDSGATCATNPPLEIACPASVAEVDVPNNYPAPSFSGWGHQVQTLATAKLSNNTQPNVHAAGNKVTWTSEGRGIQFYNERTAGSKLLIPGTAPGCPSNLCTVATTDTHTQITIQETVATPVDATLTDYGAGVKVWLENTGGSASVSASFTFDVVRSESAFSGATPEVDSCSHLPILDINTDKDGNPYQDGPKTGFLCKVGQFAQILILWIPATGEARLMSSFATPDATHRFYPPDSPFSNADAKTLFVADGIGHLWKGVLSISNGVYKEYVPGTLFPTHVPDNVTWTDLTATTSPVEQQLANLPGSAQQAFASGLFPSFRFAAVLSGYALYHSDNSHDAVCLMARSQADTNQLLQAFTSWDTYPLRWVGCHGAPVSMGPFMGVGGNPVGSLSGFSTSTPLGGPFLLNVTQLKHAGTWRSYSQAVGSATNANPVLFRAPSHGLDPNYSTVTITGATGPWAGTNGTYKATATDADHFSIPVDSTAFGAFPGSITFSAAPPLIHSKIDTIAGLPAVVTVHEEASPVQNHRLQDGDPIGFGNLDQNVQYYAKVSGYSPTTFAVYSDHGLTSPVDANLLLPATGGVVYFAETCPGGLDPQWTSQMKFDTGATGVRCITLRVAGEPCSLWAAPGEQAKYPCKADPANASKSSLQDLQVGDFIGDISDNPYRESFVIVKKTKNSETDVEITLMRWWGNLITADTHTGSIAHGNHNAGWTPLMIPSYPSPGEFGWMDINDSTNTLQVQDPRIGGDHHDFGQGDTPGLYTFAGGAPDSIPNKLPQDLINTTLTFFKKEDPAWADSPQTQLSYGYHIQTYPGHRQFGAEKTEHRWKADWRAMNNSYGNGQTQGVAFNDPMTTANIRGTAYDPGSTTLHIYKVSNIVGLFDRKRSPTYAWAGKYMFKDKSGPNSLITDADVWRYCVADNAGECRPGSAQNDTFLVTGAAVFDTAGKCWTDTLNLTAPCFIGANPVGGWAVQTQIDPVDTGGRNFRRLTLGLIAPGMHWTFANWLQTTGFSTPKGPLPLWGFFSVGLVNGLRNEFFAMKLPRWPANTDHTNRTTFFPLTRQVIASGSPYARARFGYAENGPPSSFFCASRQEACSTDVPASAANDPYSFLSETVTHQDCSSGCRITIPAVPGRVVYIVIDRLDASGNVVSTSPMEAHAIN